MQTNFRASSLSILIAFMLTIMPLPDWAIELRPDWVTLVLIYWAMAIPTRFGVTVAWIFGILLDVSTGSILGQHALGMVLAIYIVHEQHQRLRVASLLQQAIVVLFLLLMKQLVVLWVNGIVDRAPETSLFFLQSVIGAVTWPWIYIIMRDLRRKFGYRVDY
jgi:rod shape-determining protein MreD